MIIDASRTIIPYLSYYQFLGSLHKEDNLLGCMHRAYFDNGEGLITYAVKSAKHAALATCYVATLEQGSYTWQPDLMLNFSTSLVHHNHKCNPAKKEKEILEAHVFGVGDLFNNSQSVDIHSLCIDTFTLLGENKKLKEAKVHLDKTMFQNVQKRRQEVFDDRLNHAMNDINFSLQNNIPFNLYQKETHAYC